MSFEDVPGQPRAKRFLRRLFQSGRIPHAMLFSGMAGVGKAAMALELVKLLNCHAPRDMNACDACGSCLKLRKGIHPDLLVVKAERAFIKLDQIREMRARLRFQPFEGKWRGIVIENAQALNEEAANALLKLLEEPPQRNIFLLTTLEPQMLLPTILSRCCHVRFQPLDLETLAKVLEEEHRMPESKARQVARLSEGSLERARCFGDEERMGQCKETLKKIEGLGRLTILELFPLVANWVQGNEALEQDLEWIKLWMRDLILYRLLKDHQSFSVPDERTLRAAGCVSVDTLFVLYDNIEKALQQLRRNANKNLVLEGVCIAIKDDLYGKNCRNSIPQRRKSLSF
ncbi:MAG: DNA polymerase III subunit delta' [Deltaproteobacteria bacterium]|nr:DNA polymerase III subunit delta' [Deltaproteobacteria bacterium]